MLCSLSKKKFHGFFCLCRLLQDGINLFEELLKQGWLGRRLHRDENRERITHHGRRLDKALKRFEVGSTLLVPRSSQIDGFAGKPANEHLAPSCGNVSSDEDCILRAR